MIELQISRSNITTIDAGIFNGLGALIYLDLSDNPALDLQEPNDPELDFQEESNALQIIKAQHPEWFTDPAAPAGQDDDV